MSLIQSTKDHLDLLPATLPEDIRDETTLNAFRIQAELKDEIEKELARRERSTPTKKESAKMMRRMYKEKQMNPKAENVIGEAQELRMRILAASLFPNIYNQKMVMTEMGNE